MKLLIDADVLVYESAFAAQKTLYYYDGKEFNDADQAKAYCKENNLDYRQLRKDGAITSEVQVLPESAARNIFKMKLDGICNVCKSDDYRLILSGDGNFRDDYAKTRGYKANRAEVPKPHHYLFVRSLVLDNKRSEMTVGMEADDAIGIEMTTNPKAAVCTIDKDLNCIPGRHYDWGKGIKYTVGKHDAAFWFMRQLLTGDSTDNVPGIPGMGEKKATELLSPLRGEPGRMWKAVCAEYNKGPFKFKDGSITVGTPAEYLQEQGILLWIMREPEQRWSPEFYTKEVLK